MNLNHLQPFTISDRTYQLVPLSPGHETLPSPDQFVRIAKEFNAWVGDEDLEFLLEHQIEIPEYFLEYTIVFAATITDVKNFGPRVQTIEEKIEDETDDETDTNELWDYGEPIKFTRHPDGRELVLIGRINS